MLQAIPVGDINGDGYCDLTFNWYAADDRTGDLSDVCRKSVIVTEPGMAGNSFVYYDTWTYGIGDFNGDEFDDILEIHNKKILFGSIYGTGNDSLMLDYPDYITEFYFADDIDGDGMSEFLIGNNYGDSLLIFCGNDPVPIVIKTTLYGYYFYLDDETTIFNVFDYDADGTGELCISDNYDGSRYFKWFAIDKINHQFLPEFNNSIQYIHTPSSLYPIAFSDLNGDGLMDATHAYFTLNPVDSVPECNIEACFGLSSEPYFDQPVEIETKYACRTLYNGGDFNGDGAHDWYANYRDDSIVVYYGGPDILNTGFTKEYYYTGSNQLFFAKSKYSDDFILCYNIMEVLDFNYDGISDLFFNYWSFDENLQFDTIGTAIVLGGPDPDFLNPLVFGNTGNLMFQELEYGYNSKNIGDLNKDGYDDWGSLAVEGCYLDIYFGGPDLDIEHDIRYLLPQTAKSKCRDWSFGDMNGDGYIDIAISNSSDSKILYINTIMDESLNVFIFFGSPNHQSVYSYEDADVILHDMDTFYDYGRNISIVGDYNADGFDDLVVGGGKHRYCLREAFVYFGGDGLIGPGPDLVLSRPCTQCGILFAHPITACGDINADGYDDFTLGDPNNGAGLSLVYFGGPDADDQVDVILNNPDYGGLRYGSYTTRTSGDFNGDGFSDLIQYSTISKTIYIYHGGPDFDQLPDQAIFDTATIGNIKGFDYIDNSAETGISDIVVSNYNPPYLDFRVYPGGIIQCQNPGYTLKNNIDRPGVSVASGDFNNDGYTEIFAGISGEVNYGNGKGGIVLLYEPTLFVSAKENAFVKNSDISIFPNPANSCFNIEFKADDESKISVRMLSVSGNVVYSKSFAPVLQEKTKLKIFTDYPEPGIYIVEIIQGDRIYHKKVVLQ